MSGLDVWKRYERPGTAEAYERIRYRGIVRSFSAWMTWKTIERALKGLPAGSTLLDVPCGTGFFTKRLVKAGFKVLSADLSPAMLAQAKRKAILGNPLLGYLRADITLLPFPDRSFDVVLTIRLMNLIEPELRPVVLRELARVAKKKVVVSYYNRYTLNYLTRRIQGKSVQKLVSLHGLREEIRGGGLSLTKLFWKGPLLSSTMVAVCDPFPLGSSPHRLST